MTEQRDWVAPRGYGDIGPGHFPRIENDGYQTLDADWIVPALLRSVPIARKVLEPAAGRGHMSLVLKRAGLTVRSFDLHGYADPVIPNIGLGDIRKLKTLAGFDWVVTNLPYNQLDALATHLTDLGARDHCGVALLVRTEWLSAKKRRVHEHPNFAGVVLLTTRPRWIEPDDDAKSPRHNFAWCVWSPDPRVGDPWIRFAGSAA